MVPLPQFPFSLFTRSSLPELVFVISLPARLTVKGQQVVDSSMCTFFAVAKEAITNFLSRPKGDAVIINPISRKLN